MSFQIKLVMFIFSIMLFLIVCYNLKKEKIPVKYSMIWFLASLTILLVSIVPGFLTCISHLIGFEVLSNMVIGIMLVILLFISMILTIIISNQRKMLTELIQEVSLLKEKNNGK